MSEMCNCDRYSKSHNPQPACSKAAAMSAPVVDVKTAEPPVMTVRQQRAEAKRVAEQADRDARHAAEDRGHKEATSKWQKYLPTHPAADLFPMMDPPALNALTADIREDGLKHDVVIWIDANGKEWLLDGRNRLDAMAACGYTFNTVGSSFRIYNDDVPVISDWIEYYRDEHHARPMVLAADPWALVISYNINRRHLTAAQKSELIIKLLKADPTKSDRAIAETAKVDHKTVGAKRAALSATGEIPQSDTPRTGADGKTRKQPTKPDPAPAKEKVEDLGEFTAAHVERREEAAEAKAEELREVYTGVSGNVGQVQKLYLELSDQEQTYFRRWLKSQLSAAS
jgi:hypothetical protein